MEPSIKIVTLFSAILISGLSAGFFYAWEVSVIPGTKQISDRSYLEAMQSINRAILNPAFFVIFIGSLLLLIVSSYMQYRASVNLSFWLMLGATLTYLAGTFGVTVSGNVPMNETLDALNLAEITTDGLKDIRISFEEKWNLLHRIRTVFAVLSFVLSLVAAFVEKSNN
jgi:uncharacterized membrane protein